MSLSRRSAALLAVGLLVAAVAAGLIANAASLGVTTQHLTTATKATTLTTAASSHTCTFSTDTGDTYIVSGDPQHGASTSMLTNANATGNNRENSLVQFGIMTSTCLEGGTIPATATVTAATLTLTATSASGRTVGAALVGSTWSENSLTWATATSAMTAPSGTNTAVISATTATWDVKANVQSIVSGATDGGWVLWDVNTGNSATTFDTKEFSTSASHPKLVVTYT